MQIVPLQAVPSQTLNISLANQNCTISVYQKPTGLYITIELNNQIVIGGVLCENLNRIIRNLYFGFSGDFIFMDNQGQSDPYFTGLGSRYSLGYLTAAEAHDS